MIGEEDAPYTYEYGGYYKILPAIHNWSSDAKRINKGKKVPENFRYSSDNNKDWMSIENLQEWIKENKDKIGRI